MRFLGLQRNVEPFMQAADCLVCPSLWAEAAGLVNLEAHASGLPVLASRIGGIPEYVADGETGLLFEPENAGALADAVVRLAADPDLVKRLGDNGRRAVSERYDRRVLATRYAELLQWVHDGRAVAGSCARHASAGAKT